MGTMMLGHDVIKKAGKPRIEAVLRAHPQLIGELKAKKEPVLLVIYAKTMNVVALELSQLLEIPFSPPFPSARPGFFLAVIVFGEGPNADDSIAFDFCVNERTNAITVEQIQMPTPISEKDFKKAVAKEEQILLAAAEASRKVN